MKGRTSRKTMDQVEIMLLGHVTGDPEAGQDPLTTVCEGCHGDKSDEVSCNAAEWKKHLSEGRVADKVWEHVSVLLTDQPAPDGTICGW